MYLELDKGGEVVEDLCPDSNLGRSPMARGLFYVGDTGKYELL